MSETKTYETLIEILHDGKKYPPGDSIELDPEDAVGLLKYEAILHPVKPSGQGAGNTAPILPNEVPEEYKEYSGKTNAEQLEYIKKLANPTKEQLEELLKYSKSKSAKLIDSKIKELVS